MTRTNLSVVALCLAAGTSLSVAQAGGNGLLAVSGNKVSGSRGETPPAKAEARFPARATNASGRTHQLKLAGSTVSPSKMIVNGRAVPFTSSDTIGSAGATDGLPTKVYDAFNDASTGADLFTATIGTSNTPINLALDDIQMGNTSGATTIGGFRYRWATDASIGAADTYWIILQWYDGFNGSSSPVVNQNAVSGFVATEWDAPATGWAGDTIYSSSFLTSDFLPSDFTTAASAGALEWMVLEDDGTGIFGPTPYSHVTPVFTSTAPSVGSSTNGIFFANNVIDADFITGPYNPPIVTFQNSSGNPVVANLALSLLGYVNGGPSYGGCCLPNIPTGGCMVMQQTICTGQGGVWKGAGTNCDLTNANKCAGLGSGIIFNNGPLSTGTVTWSGQAAAAGRVWSEAVGEKQPGGLTICAGNLRGIGSFNNGPLADDFVVPAGESWSVTGIKFYMYLSGGASTTQPVTSLAHVALWKGAPNASGSTIVAGDQTTARAVTGTALNTYAAFSTVDGSAAALTGRVWEITWTLPSAVTLSPGHYWWDMSTSLTSNSVYTPLVKSMTSATVGGTLDTSNNNALSAFKPDDTTLPYVWSGVYDDNLTFSTAVNDFVAGTCLPHAAELPFQLVGNRIAGCYANCDGSTGTPSLTAADFTCFLTKFRANDAYANCDGSTGTPSLTAADFTCFLTKFRAGCP